MTAFFVLCYLFMIGSSIGWFLELFYRRFFSKMNPERKWINPGFCIGPYVPIYGFGLTILYLLSNFCNMFFMPYGAIGYVLLFIFMAIAMTLIELIAGAGCLKFFNLRLWDYKNEWANFKGLICPKFSFYWTLGGVGYYFLMHSHIRGWIETLLSIVPLLFFIGMYYGLMLIDFIHSAELVQKIRTFAKDHEVVVNYETLKAQLRHSGKHFQRKVYFMTFFRAELSIKELLEKFYKENEERKNRAASAHQALAAGENVTLENGNVKNPTPILERIKDVFDVFEDRKRKKEHK